MLLYLFSWLLPSLCISATEWVGWGAHCPAKLEAFHLFFQGWLWAGSDANLKHELKIKKKGAFSGNKNQKPGADSLDIMLSIGKPSLSLNSALRQFVCGL